jgi:hypothetical protein
VGQAKQYLPSKCEAWFKPQYCQNNTELKKKKWYAFSRNYSLNLKFWSFLRLVIHSVIFSHDVRHNVSCSSLSATWLKGKLLILYSIVDPGLQVSDCKKTSIEENLHMLKTLRVQGFLQMLDSFFSLHYRTFAKGIPPATNLTFSCYHFN